MTTTNDTFDALRYAGIKDNNRDVCEHCDRTYLREMPIDGLERCLRVRIQCDECGGIAKQLDALLRHGFNLRDALATAKHKAETAATIKQVAELEGMIDEHRRVYKNALDSCRAKIQNIRRQHGK